MLYQQHHTTGHYVNPEASTNPSDPPYDFNTNGKFLPYVYHVYGDGYHQLEVNHKSAKFGGCGTYNHPYVLTSNADFIAIQNILQGTPKLSIGDYISELKVYGNGNSGLQVLLDGDDYLDALGDDDDDTTLIVRAPTSSLQKTFNDADSYSYRIPITFKVKTGSELESDGLYYSNYMLTVEAKMYEAAQGGTFVTSSDAMDHIIYTNAKIHTSVITAP